MFFIQIYLYSNNLILILLYFNGKNEYNFKSFGRTLDIDGIKQLSGRYGRQSSNEWEQRERTSEMQDPVDRESGSLPIDRQNSPNKKKKMIRHFRSAIFFLPATNKIL